MGNSILLADKSITIQKIVELTFADENYTIKSVSDGQAALEAIPEFHPDLLLADISLPLKNGYELCRTLRTDPAYSSFSNIPVILLAGIYETMDEERMHQVEEKVKEVGASGLLSKPFDPQLLILKVKTLMPESSAGAAASAPGGEAIFAETPTAEAVSEEAEPSEMGVFDDSERTMMIPQSLAPAGNMFAETPPFEGEEQEAAAQEPARAPVDIETVKPVSEPVFEMEEAPQSAAAAEGQPEEFEPVEPPEFEAGSGFLGREEQEFATEEPEKEEVLEGPTLILPTAEEPFGDVLEAAAPAGWAPAVVSDEDAPFGLPQPVEPEVITETPPAETGAVEPSASVMGSVSVPEPELEREQGMPLSAESEQATVTVAAETAAQPEYYEDTWPGVPVVAENKQQPVDELFEAEEAAPATRPSEEAEELQPDLSEGGFGIEVAAAEPLAEMVPSVAAAPSAPVEITDELVDRIVERVVARLSERIVSEIVWQVVPDLAEKMIRRELEKLHAADES